MTAATVGGTPPAPVLRGYINPTQQMEQFQLAYLHAVATAAGCTITSWSVDDGIDAHLRFRDVTTSPQRDYYLEIQLKATYSVAPGAKGAVSVQFDRDRFELFADDEPTLHKIVVIMVQPQKATQWVRASHSVLELSHCCYWVNIAGQTTTAASPTVSASRGDIFDDLALCAMMNRIISGGAP